MAADTQSPVLFLAFANEQAQSARYLRNLPEELSRLRQILEQAHAPYQVIFYPNLKIEELLDGLRKYRRRIALFHYGGHSNSYSLLLQSLNEQPVVAHAGGLAKLLAHQHGLHLIFLNGCANRTQAQALLAAGIAVVIATSAAIHDQVAMAFAAHFYEELALDATIAEAFQRAEAALEVQYGSNSRHLVTVSSPAETAEAPWQLYYRDEAALQWRLADVIDNPCWGLPPLPQQPLPQQPFRHLDRFRCEDAELFFGRCAELRNLYERVIDPTGAPVILLYGQSGVGKSSLLDAGLLPRLAADTVCHYRRRDHAAGLIADLTAALGLPTDDQPVAAPPWHDIWRTREAEVQKPVVMILDQIEEIFTRPHSDQPHELADFLQVVQTIFGQEGQSPQGKLILSFRKEYLAEVEKRLQEYSILFVKTFLEPLNKRGIIEAITGVAHTPRLAKQYGLVVTKELPPLIADDLLDDQESPLAPTLQILLTKLWEQATHRNQSHPVFDETLYRNLKREGIALQDFLTQQLHTLRTLDRVAVDSGLALDLLVYHTTSFGTADQHSIAEILGIYTPKQHRKASIPAAKRMPFLHSFLSLLDAPVQRETQNLDDVHARLKQLVQQCKDLYLLTEAAGDQATDVMSRLAHDALAPLLRVRFDRSDAPGQRARRVLENRAREWQAGQQGMPLDDQDLSLVEQGQPGMRTWTPDERRLVTASRRARTRRRWTRRGLGFAALLAVLLFLAYAGFTWLHDENQENRLLLQEAQRLATLALQQITVDPVASLVVARQALPNQEEPKPYLPQAEFALTQALQTSLERVYRQVAQPPLTAEQVAFGKSAIGVGGDALRGSEFPGEWITTLTTESELIAAVTWNETGEALLGRGARRAYVWHAGQPLMTQEFNQLLACAEWQPERPRIAICSGNTLRLWSYADNTLESIHDFAQNVLRAQWSPDGSLLAAWDIAPQAGEQTLVVWNAQTKQIELTTTISDTQRIKTIAWSPDSQQLAVGLATATVQIWPIQQHSIPLTYKSGQNVDGILFVEASRLLTWGVGDSVRLWSVAGEELAQFGENVGVVEGVQLTPDQQRVLLFLNNGAAQEYVIATGERLVSYIGHRRRILTAAWHNGYLATSSIDGTARIWDATSGQAVITLAGHTGRIPGRADVLGVHWLADGRLITYGEDGSLRIWQLFDEQGLPLCNGVHRSGQPRCYAHSRAFPGYTEEISSARWLDDDTILTVEQDGTAQRLTPSTGALIRQPAEPDLYPEVRWDPQGERLLTYVEEAFLEEGQNPNGIIRDLLTGERLAEIPGPIASAFWLDGGLLISREAAAAQLVDPATGGALTHLSTITSLVTAARFNSSGQLAIAMEDGIIHILNAQTGAETIRLGDDEAAAESLPVSELYWTTDGKRLLTAGSNIALWDVERKRKLWTTPGNLFNTAHAAFSPDEQLVAGTLDTAVFVLDADTGIPQTEEIQQAHTALIHGIQWLRDRQWPYQDDYPPLVSRFMRWLNGAAWSADTTRFLLLTWSEDGAATLWDWENRTAIIRLGDLDRISVAAVSPDGSQILTASTTEAMDVVRVRIWPSWRQAPDALLQLATEHAIRPLSPAQVEQFAIP
ncbi:MAG: CHAT domain-containing protein [Caldilineaceae bacterium]